MFGIKKPPERKANLFYRFGYLKQPGESRVESEFCFKNHKKTRARQEPKPNTAFSKVAKKMTIRFEAQGNPKTSSLEELRLTGILGQTDPNQTPERIMGNNYQNPIGEDMD